MRFDHRNHRTRRVRLGRVSIGKDDVRMHRMMLQQDIAEDFAIATGKQISVREFVKLSARKLVIEPKFEGEGVSKFATVVAAIEK